MSILVDTNVLLRFSQKSHRQNPIAAQAINTLRQRNEQLMIVPQNIYEFWVVATRPLAENGLGYTNAQAVQELVYYRTGFSFLPDPPMLYDEWERLVTAYTVSGKTAHDTRLVAAMTMYGIGKILTFNMAHFQRYAPEGIAALDPATV